jgi:hypothetical protein
LEKRKEPTTKKKDADEEPLGDDTKFTVHLLKSAFSKLQDVGEAFDIKSSHEVDKDPSVKGLTFRIHGLAVNLENLPVVKRVGRHFDFDDGSSDGSAGSHSGDDGSDSSHNSDDGGTTTVATD